MLTCLHVYLRPHVVRHWPTLTIIWHHLTPIWLPYQDAPLQQALGIHFDSWFLHFGFRFSHWFSIRSIFQRFPTLPTVPRGPRVPSQAPKSQKCNFLTYTCEPSVTGQGFLGAIIPCTAGNRISRGEPPPSAWNYSLLPTSATPNIEEYLKLVTDVDNSCETLTYSSIRTAGNGITREKTQPQLAANE